MFLPIWTTQHGTHNMATYQGKIDSSKVVTQFLHVTHVIREISDDPEMSSETSHAHCCMPTRRRKSHVMPMFLGTVLGKAVDTRRWDYEKPL